MTTHKPQTVTFIAIGVLIIGLIQLWQAVTISSQSLIAIDYGASSTQIQVRTILTFVWACIWIWQAFQLYRHRQSYPTLFPLGCIIVLYTLFRLALALMSASPIDQQRWIVLLVLAVSSIVAGLIYQRRNNSLSNVESQF